MVPQAMTLKHLVNGWWSFQTWQSYGSMPTVWEVLNPPKNHFLGRYDWIRREWKVSSQPHGWTFVEVDENNRKHPAPGLGGQILQGKVHHIWPQPHEELKFHLEEHSETPNKNGRTKQYDKSVNISSIHAVSNRENDLQGIEGSQNFRQTLGWKWGLIRFFPIKIGI